MSTPEIVLQMGPGSKNFSRRAFSLPAGISVSVGRSMPGQMKSFANSFFESSVVSKDHGSFKYKLGRFYYTALLVKAPNRVLTSKNRVSKYVFIFHS